MKKVILGVMCILCLFASSQGREKSTKWKAYVPADAYKELTERSIKTIESLAKSDDKNAVGKVQVEAAILIGYTLAVDDVKNADVSMLRGAGILASRRAKDNDVKSLAEFSKQIKGSTVAPADVMLLKTHQPTLDDLMELFRNKTKGGEGIHADLQYSPQLKNLNGIEALIGALAKKKLTETNADKVAKELPMLAYRIAVVGTVTHEMAPEKGAAQWRELAGQMRQSSTALAEAASKKNAEDIQKAATTLEDSCTRCHSAFKKK